MSDSEPKIIIDSDWKVQAQREKEQLAKEAEQKAAHGPLPSPQFLEILNMLAMQAMIGLGGMQMPDGKVIPPDVSLAQHHIDLLDVLKQKTKGNLDEQEQKIFDATVHELRMAYVQVVGGVNPSGKKPG